LADASLRRTLGNNGRQTVARRFSAAEMAAAYCALYDSTAHSSRKEMDG
jgi:hypothetical protein